VLSAIFEASKHPTGIKVMLDDATVAPLSIQQGMDPRLRRELAPSQIDKICGMQMSASLAWMVEVLDESDGTCDAFQAANAEGRVYVDNKQVERGSGTRACQRGHASRDRNPFAIAQIK
jgi:hypothetical protein